MGENCKPVRVQARMLRRLDHFLATVASGKRAQRKTEGIEAKKRAERRRRKSAVFSGEWKECDHRALVTNLGELSRTKFPD